MICRLSLRHSPSISGHHCICPGKPFDGVSLAPGGPSSPPSSAPPPKREVHFWRLALRFVLASSIICAISFGSLRAAFIRAIANSCTVRGGLSAPLLPSCTWSSSSLSSRSRSSRSCRAARSASVSSIARLIRLPEITERCVSSRSLFLCFFLLLCCKEVGRVRVVRAACGAPRVAEGIMHMQMGGEGGC
ncbi:hypothetical protein T492DRAFT_936347 [Pavlovales sp. CCMP2436]|nr:hypothetical protein T492DRAFT_936347 [Pavlovales sp. CCMP2436]